VNNISATAKEVLLALISEEKESFGKYTQLCAQYQVQPDPIVIARHQGKVEILQKLLQDKTITKT
jgi:hypothetical protein